MLCNRFLISCAKNASKATKFVNVARPASRFISASTKNYTEEDLADHSWRQSNHIWTKEEIEICVMEAKTKLHKPVTFSDHVMHAIMKVRRVTTTRVPLLSIYYRLFIIHFFLFF